MPPQSILSPLSTFHRILSKNFSSTVICRGIKIYTKTGDKGTSALYTGERRRKSDLRFEALGTVDELSSHIGMTIANAEEAGHSLTADLTKVQCILQDIGSFVATPETSARDAHKMIPLSRRRTLPVDLHPAAIDYTGKLSENLHFDESYLTELESQIDEMTKQLPPLTNFILPSGGKTSASLHIARSVCRRAERRLSHLLLEESLNEPIYKYINRLSDYLFTLARYVAHKEGNKENIYTRPR